MKAVSNVLMPDDVNECLDALSRFAKGLLIIDWECGSAEVTRILSENAKSKVGSLRMILLIADTMTENLVAIAAEYNVNQIYTEKLQLKTFGARLASMMVTEGGQTDLKKALTESHDAREKKKWPEALAPLQKLQAKQPDNLRLKAETADLYLQMGEWQKAAAALAGIEKSKPPYLRGLHLYGRCLMQAGRFEEAAKVMESANLFNPNDIDRLIDIGNTFLQLDKTKEAKEKFDAALALSAGSHEASVGKSKCLLLDGHVNDALAIMREVSGDVEMASIFNTSAVMSMRSGRHDAGMKLYQAALKALGKDDKIQARLYFNMGVGYRRSGQPDKAAPCFDQALKLDPKFEKARENALLVASSAVAAPQKIRPGPMADPSKDGIEEERLPGQDQLPGSFIADFGVDDFAALDDDDLEDDLEIK
jgi:tetratricopeptide (TPR) repeat protein